MATGAPTADFVDDLDVLIIGAGFAGLRQLHVLRKKGFNVKVYDAGADLGGVWHWNCYPGARVDSELQLYQYSDPDIWQDFDFAERYPDWRQLRAYFDHVDKKLELRKDIRFKKRVSAAQFDEATNRWIVETADGARARTHFINLAVGQSSAFFIPDELAKTMSTFRGEIHHSARWPQEGVSSAGKRIAVIGTGASGVQMTQEFARDAERLTVFQRTPNIALPMRQVRYDSATMAKEKTTFPDAFIKRNQTFTGQDYEQLPTSGHEANAEERSQLLEELWRIGGFRYWIGAWNDVFTDATINRVVYDFWRDKTRPRIKDPKLAEKLAPMEPPHPFGTKRPSLEQGYYDVFNQNNVELVDLRETPFDRFTEKGVLTKDGVEREFDLIALATGFDAVTGELLRIDIHGVGGQTLKQKWSDGATAYLGIMTAGFPNLFFMNGPQSPNAFIAQLVAVERNADWLAECLTYLRENEIDRIEAQPSAEAAWAEHTNEVAAPTLFPLADSWYVGANVPGKKRQILFYAGGQSMYYGKCSDVAANGYEGFVLEKSGDRSQAAE
jgi:cation diffusion facilitator CzcD-associated flavoprotein CzcO